MKEISGSESERIGADRVLSPGGALPQPAQKLDVSGPVRPWEFEITVEKLCLDSTSHREIRERCDGDPERMADRIREIVESRGKMHNPATDSGGVLTGTCSAVGSSHRSAPQVGERVATLASLTLTPLDLVDVVAVDPESPQVEVVGTAYIPERVAWASMPDDLPTEKALEIYDVCAAASHVRELADGAGAVTVLGAGHAGAIALAAARDVAPGAELTVVDVSAPAAERAVEVGLADIPVSTDLRDPLAALADLRSAGSRPANLTVVVVNAPGCEPASILATADEGTVLFFSMATSFQAAALVSDGLSSRARMIVGSGFSPDRGSYALDLVRRSPGLRAALEIEVGAAA